MRVVHVSFSSTGGAGRGALALHRSLVSAGIDSHFICIYKPPEEDRALAPPGTLGKVTTRGLIYADRWVVRASGSRAIHEFSVNPIGSRFVSQSIRELDPDIVNLHWIGNGIVSPRQIAAFRRPIVWTVRDMWPFTGGCHLTGGCEAYKMSCGRCPVLGSSRRNDLSSWGQRRKNRAWKEADIHVVAISHWMARRIRESRILGESSQRVIYPGIDTESFRPLDRDAARERLGLSRDRKLVGFVAHAPLRDHWKGFHLLLEALPEVDKSGIDFDLVVVGEPGNGKDSLSASDERSTWLGPLRSDDALAHFYSAVDLIVAPSLEEAFGKVGAESLACGTPVVTFRGTGLEEIVSDGETGYAVSMGDPVSLARGIVKVLERDSQEFAAPARERATRLFGLRQQAEAYVDLYEALLRKGHLNAHAQHDGELE